MVTLYHGTDKEIAHTILENGVDILSPRRADPGDLGWGFYVTENLPTASVRGTTLSVTFDDSKMADISNPYFIDGLIDIAPKTIPEILFHTIAFKGGNLLTVTGNSREEIAKIVREKFLKEGYTGIRAKGQSVIFDPDIIEEVEKL